MCQIHIVPNSSNIVNHLGHPLPHNSKCDFQETSISFYDAVKAKLKVVKVRASHNSPSQELDTFTPTNDLIHNRNLLNKSIYIAYTCINLHACAFSK